MYMINFNEVKTQVGFARSRGVPIEESENDAITYTRVVMDVVLEMLNNPDKDFNYTSDLILATYPQDARTAVFSVMGIAIEQSQEVLRHFMQCGFDPRLKYKLRTRQFNFHTEYCIMMDLDKTYLDFIPSEAATPVGDVVDDNPSPEVMNDYMSTYFHPGR